jgi:regulatory protein
LPDPSRRKPEEVDGDPSASGRLTVAKPTAHPAAQRSAKPEPTVKEAALAMLGRRTLSGAGLREKLLLKFPEQRRDSTRDDAGSEIEQVIARFADLGLLDDVAYAESFVRDRFLRAGYGRRRIAQDLQRKGVAAADIEVAIERVVDEPTERKMAERALERFRARRGHVDDARKVRDAAFRHLIGRGFSVSLVRDLLGVS